MDFLITFSVSLFFFLAFFFLDKHAKKQHGDENSKNN